MTKHQSWWIVDGEVLANAIYNALVAKDNGELSFNEIIDIYDNQPMPIFKKTEGACWDMLNKNPFIKRDGTTVIFLPKKLRIETGCGMLDCARALRATDYDMEKAKKHLKDKFDNPMMRLVTLDWNRG